MKPQLAPTADATELVELIVAQALRLRASDIHVEPTAAGYEIRYRVDGLLQTATKYDQSIGRGVVGRFMVLAQLLTYRLDVPQEGRLEITVPLEAGASRAIQTRLAIMPTTHGLRAAIRMPSDGNGPATLRDLGLPQRVNESLERFALADAGLLAVTGPAGSGKTTTIYALLDHIVRTQPGLSIISLEDPVERDVAGVTQIEVKPFGELTYERALRSILRQDPQVLALGEIRDTATASLALQAALSGHRLICTFHASSPGGALARLFEMRMEPYQISSSLFAVVAQRLLRRRDPAGGYRGRIVAAEVAMADSSLRAAILRHGDAESLQQVICSKPHHQTLRQSADELIASGQTDLVELQRSLGLP